MGFLLLGGNARSRAELSVDVRISLIRAVSFFDCGRLITSGALLKPVPLLAAGFFTSGRCSTQAVGQQCWRMTQKSESIF